ncbi:MAG: hypothetical protein KGL48_17535 [Sphingomonadales bacterium]|nr:hypothetical protein [Sphingomonadales bacterium]MDE2570683.1 hypothetical protein [Sphingomonadales bacterium]
MRRRTWITILAGLATALPYYWLLIDNGPSSAAGQSRQLAIASLRTLANALPGAKPTSVTYEIVATRLEPGTLLVAGGGLKRQPVSAIVFRLHSPSGDTVIDSGVNSRDVKAAGFNRFSPPNAARAHGDMLAAAHIVFTSEQPGAMDGFLGHPDFARLAPKAELGFNQSPHSPGASLLPWPNELGDLRLPPQPGAPRAIAPGIVQINAPGYSAGSQMYFVQYANGTEMLFAGEVVPMRRNLDWLRLRSHYDTDIRKPSSRLQHRAWLSAVAALARGTPELVVVPGHDSNWLRSKQVRRLFGETAEQALQEVTDD